MDLSLTLHGLAGLGALLLGLGTLARAPRRPRNRGFALLCLALATWNLGLIAHDLAPERTRPALRGLYLAGSCATAPLALQFALGLAGVARRRRLAWVAPGWLLAGGLWGAAWASHFETGLPWAVAAIAILGSMLVAGLAIIASRALSLPTGPERRALLLMFGGGVIGVIGSLSDFVPRGRLQILNLGPISVLLFLLVVCAVVVRHRFLDIDVFLARLLSLIAGASATALLMLVVVRYLDPPGRFVTLFLASLLILSLAVPLGRLVLTRARSLLSPSDPVALALQQVSRKLTQADDTADIWRVFEQGCATLPGDVDVDVYLRRGDQTRFHLVFRAGQAERETTAIEPDDGLPRLLEAERVPLTRRFLKAELSEAATPESRIEEGLSSLERLGHRLVVPVFRGERLSGWIAVGGGLAERHLTAEVATAFLAVGNQAIASLGRIEAVETARRHEAQAAVGALAAGLAHEVRNPVAAIRGAAQAMGPEATGSQQAEMREVIEEETGRLGRFVGEFLDYARPASPRREAVDPAELLQRALRGLELAGAKIESEIVVDQDPPPRVAADPDQLRRAFDNLLRNAWEAGGDGVHVRCEVNAQQNGRVTIRIEDNGPGIPMDEVARLFQPFHTTKDGGTGLGLALIHRIVEAHGGEIRVEGRPGIGAAFTLSLPAATRGSAA